MRERERKKGKESRERANETVGRRTEIQTIDDVTGGNGDQARCQVGVVHLRWYGYDEAVRYQRAVTHGTLSGSSLLSHRRGTE